MQLKEKTDKIRQRKAIMAKPNIKALEENLWNAADKLRADGGVSASKYSTPVLGLIFLRFATLKYDKYRKEIEAEYEACKNGRNAKKIEDIAQAKCGYYLPDKARYDYLLSLPESEDIPNAIKKAMELIEQYAPELRGSLPKEEYLELTPTDETTTSRDYSLVKELLKILDEIPADISGDLFGKVYEYFLGKFALKEGQGGGEFFTPTSVVRLMVEMIEPYGGTILDPACGSGGMFVQSQDFVERRREEQKDTAAHELIVSGVEKDKETVKIARMNMFLNGLRNEITCANSYYSDPYNCYGKFDFVMANPPFNVDDVNYVEVAKQKRFNEYGIPKNKSAKKDQGETVPNANYLWINLFATSLKPQGRAALVMANSASDAGKSEAEIRQRLIESGIISGMLSLPKNMFYTVTLPATLWFFDKARTDDKRILFIDARNIFRQIDRAHREFTDEQIQNIACIRHLYQGDKQFYDKLIAKYDADIAALSTAFKTAQKQAEEAQEKYEKNDNKKQTNALKRALDEANETLKQAKADLDYQTAQKQWLTDRFPDGEYTDVTGLCKAATLEEIREQDYSLNPGRYVGVVIEDDGLTAEDFQKEMSGRIAELNELNQKANELMAKINEDFRKVEE